jgi:hypothetical protein
MSFTREQTGGTRIEVAVVTVGRVAWAERAWAAFYRCPNSGRILTALRDDNKALCGCGRSNPAIPDERAERNGTHFIDYLEAASAADFVA